MPNHTNQKLSLGASIPVASNRFQSVIRHFPELGILTKIVNPGRCSPRGYDATFFKQ